MPLPCPEWEYRFHPQRNELFERANRAVVRLRDRRQPDVRTLFRDCRPLHRELFTGLTPPGFNYFAGHYRGEKSRRCLDVYQVGVDGDTRVGVPPSRVMGELLKFRSQYATFLTELDASQNDPTLTADRRIYLAVATAAAALVEYLRIHPYANGNGHLARFFVWAILGQYDLWPIRWPVDPRPPGDYVEAIVQHRNGNYAPLERFIFDALE